MTDRRTAAVIRAMKKSPGTLRALAREAGVSVAVLSRILTGQRPATARVALAVARALDRCAARYSRAAAGIRRHTDRGTR